MLVLEIVYIFSVFGELLVFNLLMFDETKYIRRKLTNNELFPFCFVTIFRCIFDMQRDIIHCETITNFQIGRISSLIIIL